MITLDKVSKSFDTFSLKQISFSIPKGEYVVILGPSGAGKTVLLEIIAGLTATDSGTVSGVTHGKTGFIYQDYLLFPHLTVRQNISYGLKVRSFSKSEIAAKVAETSAFLEITHLLDRMPDTLSGGEKQRVAIARALVTEPELFLLDEPTAALDQNKRYEIQQLFMKLHKKTGATSIHVTHDFEEALSVADRIIVLHEGSVIQNDLPEVIFREPANLFVADFVGYRNVFKGLISDNIFTTSGISMYVDHPDSFSCYAALSSHDIILSNEPFASSARNSFRGSVEKIVKKQVTVDITVNIGIPVHAEITRKSLEEMNLDTGSELFITFKSSSLLIFSH